MKIATDDALLFGSLVLAAIGAGFVAAATTGDILAAVGVAMLGFGIPTALIIFMAASEEPT